MNTARRRRDYARKKRQARRLYGDDCRRWQMFANTMTACSCDFCGNPRKHFKKLSCHELREMQREQDVDGFFAFGRQNS